MPIVINGENIVHQGLNMLGQQKIEGIGIGGQPDNQIGRPVGPMFKHLKMPEDLLADIIDGSFAET